MIPIRKQLFGILLGVGILIIFSVSLAVNIAIKRHFELYLETNIKHAGDIIVKLLSDLYEKDQWKYSIQEQLTVETYLGKFEVCVLTPDKKIIWETTQENLLEEIKNRDNNPIAFYTTKSYRFEDRPIYSKAGELIGYARIGYFASGLLYGNDLKFQKDVNEAILLCGTTILGCFIIIGLYISGLFTHHIHGIARTSIALAEGKLTSRYESKSKIKEIETLRYSMNHLAERLEQQDAIRKKLIGDVSHEIRTPLHILQSNLEAMIDGFYPIDEEQMQILYKEVVRFGKLLNNLDGLKTVEECVMNMDRKVLSLNESVKEVFDAFKIIAKEKKIKYILKDNDTQHVQILGDKDSLKQLWMNIISNAFKFTECKGEVKINTIVNQKTCSVIIQDTGVGIAAEDMPYVFERLYRADKSREKYEGNGIGLTIVKSVVSLHEGQIDIDSQEGVGTTVTVTLPINHIKSHPNNIGDRMKSYIKLGNKNEKV